MQDIQKTQEVQNTNKTQKLNIILISFYNTKSIGLRNLENALSKAGYSITIVYFKKFNSAKPKLASVEEMGHIKNLITELNPLLVGFSVMSSLYLEAVESLNAEIKKSTPALPIVWGGVYATMFAEKCLGFADFVIRGEGEEALIELANLLKDDIASSDNELLNIQNLAFIDSSKNIQINDLRNLSTDLDQYGGMAEIGVGNKYTVEDNSIICVDPLTNSLSYEISASRGCPYACSYCCSINLLRLNSKKGKYVRFRDVDKVIEELLYAKSKMSSLKVIHFWDEIFSTQEGWVDHFVERYKKEIGLPFEIWGHPLQINETLMQKLRNAGLYKVVMGIQSGSPYIRKEIFNRNEKQEDIINASKILAKCGIPQVVYDLMLRHPFETLDTLKETYALCLELEPPFELQLHGLTFFPGTDIVQKAIDMNLVTPEDMEKQMYAPMKDQYHIYWDNEHNNPAMNYMYKLIYLTQFPGLKKKSFYLAQDTESTKNHAKVDSLYKRAKYMARLRYYYKKGVIVIRGFRSASL